MARAGILYSQVAKAAATLAADGINPTVDNVRIAMGGTGSKSTIAPMLKQWKAEHHGEIAANKTGLPADLLESIRSVYERLETRAQVQVEQLREAHEQQRHETTVLLDAERSTAQQLQDDRTALSTELERTKKALTDVHEKLQCATVRIAGLLAENEGFSRRVSDRGAEVTLLVEQLAQMRRQFEHFQLATAEQRQSERQASDSRIAMLEQDLESCRNRLFELRESLGIAQHEQAHAERTLADTRNAARESAVQLKCAVQQLTDSRNQAIKGHHAAEIAEFRVKDAHAQSAQLRTLNATLAEQIVLMRGQLTAFLPAPFACKQRRG